MQANGGVSGWVVPAAILGVLGLALQGAKAAWDLYLGIVNRRSGNESARLQQANAAMMFVEGLPLDQTQKTLHKMEIIKLLQQGAEIKAIYEVVKRAIVSASN